MGFKINKIVNAYKGERGKQMKKIKFKIRKMLEKIIFISYLRRGYESFTITENGVVTAIHFYKV